MCITNLFIWWPESRGLRVAHRSRLGSFLDLLWNGQLFHCFSITLSLSLPLVLNFLFSYFSLPFGYFYLYARVYVRSIQRPLTRLIMYFVNGTGKDIFKSPSRRESSTFVGKPIGMILSSVSIPLPLSFGTPSRHWRMEVVDLPVL